MGDFSFDVVLSFENCSVEIGLEEIDLAEIDN